MVNISRKAPIMKKKKMGIYEEQVSLTSTYTRRVKEGIHIRLHPNNITGIVKLKLLKHGIELP